jgi:sugar lactone lactonase YvrE
MAVSRDLGRLKVRAMSLSFACIADVKCRIAESPVYDERTNRVFFVDIPNCKLFAMDIADAALRSWTFESEVCSLGLAASGRVVVALRDTVILFDPATEARSDICRIEAERPETRLNDGKVGPDGAFWVGSMDDRPEKAPIGALYRVDPAGGVERKAEGLFVSNGLAWTADGEIMFHADSRGPWIDRWRFDRWAGTIADRVRFAEPGEASGRPDGGTCDARGFYWSAGVSAGRLNRFGPDGRIVEAHSLPVPAPTMPCFGGPDFRTIFLTSLREGRPAALLEEAPLSGGVLAAEAAVAGFAPWRFLDT